jgi:energy-coupling factor transport system ATP-binding protein
MLLTVSGLSYTYPGGSRPALDSVSLSVARGEYLAVLGANGSGKSTLARLIARLIAPDAGSVLVDSAHRVPTALVFQSPGDQIVAETVELDVAFGPENLGVPRDEMLSAVPAALAAFGLAEAARDATHGLTSGAKQRLALAGSTALDPAVLVLDEPTSMLSPSARDSLLAYLDRFHGSGGTVLHITHDLAEASRADRVIVMDDGHIVFDGALAAFARVPIEDLARWGLSDRELPPAVSTETVTPAAFVAPAIPAAPAGLALECLKVSLFSLQDFSLSIKPGTVTAVMGDSGSGKTLLLELLAGLRAPESGTLARGEGLTAALAVQESESSLFAEFVADDVAYGPRNQGLSGGALVARVSSAMDMVGLPFERFAERRTFSLSGGERRKAALAGIIAMDTGIILLDEPSSALDARSRGQLMRLIRSLKDSGKTVVFTTNRVEECAVADEVVNLPPPAPRAAMPAGTSGSAGAAGLAVEDSGARQKRASRAKAVRPTREQAALERLRSGAASYGERRTSPFHRLPPALKYIVCIAMIAAALAVSGWPLVLALIALETIPVLVAHYPIKRLFLGLLKILPWIIFFGIIQYLMTPDLLYPLLFILRFVALYIPLCVFTFVTSHTEIMYGMEDILFPFKALGLPVRDVSLVTGIVFRFIPLLYDEASRITTARIIRGAGKGARRGLFATVQSMASLFVPLILRTLTRAERLAQAITARYYGAGKNSRYLHWKTEICHLILGIAVTALAALLIFASRFFGK